MYLLTWIFICLGVLVTLLSIAIILLRQKSNLIFGIYPDRNIFYRLKYGIALLVLKHLRHKFYSVRAKDLNTTEYFEKIDKPQEFSANPKSYDVITFMGANERGQKLMIHLERRRRGILKACIYLWLPDVGLYCSPKLPDMIYFTTDGKEENKEFRGNGFHIYPEACMRIWHLTYNGDLRSTSDNKIVTVAMDLKFSSKLLYFNYNRDLSASVVADSVAREAWNDDFYNMLRNIDQMLETRTHYEQSGIIEGEIKIGTQEFELKLNGFRDHSFGTERCLSTVYRYVYFALFLNDGTSIIVGNLSQPTFFLSSLKVGYVCTCDGHYKPITSCNFELYSYGEKGTPPKYQNFIVHTAEAKYFVQITVQDTAKRYAGGDWQSKVYNQFVSCTVNGIPGHGLTEYLYRHKGGRPESVSGTDPEWYQSIRKFERSLSNGEYMDDEVFFF